MRHCSTPGNISECVRKDRRNNRMCWTVDNWFLTNFLCSNRSSSSQCYVRRHDKRCHNHRRCHGQPERDPRCQLVHAQPVVLRSRVGTWKYAYGHPPAESVWIKKSRVRCRCYSVAIPPMPVRHLRRKEKATDKEEQTQGHAAKCRGRRGINICLIVVPTLASDEHHNRTEWRP